MTEPNNCEILSLPTGNMELTQQLESQGLHFSHNSVIHHFKEHSVFREARAVIQSFVPDAEVRSVLRETYHDPYFRLRCEPDDSVTGQKATYRLAVDDSTDIIESRADVVISPRALTELYQPVLHILGDIDPSHDPDKMPEVAARIAYQGIYTKILAEFMVKQHVLPELDGRISKLPTTLEYFYESQFPKKPVEDFAVRLDRIAMCVGGAVLFRQTANQMEEAVRQTSYEAYQIGQLLKMYALGRKDSDPSDEQRVAFSLSHAFDPSQMAKFMRAWFSS